MKRPPDFDELVGDVGADERERLHGAHELLVAADPPPEVPPWLEHAPVPWLRPERKRQPVMRRVLLAAAAVLAGISIFVLGMSAADSEDEGFAAARVVELRGAGPAPNAEGAILVGRSDAAGNIPMRIRISGLPEQPPEGYYSLYLVRDGKPIAECGTFRVRGPATTIELSVGYDVNDFEGWVVTSFMPGGSHDPEKQPVVLRA